jgi:hypothetical protein
MCRTSSSPDCNQCIRKLLWQPLKENLRNSILHRSSKASILCAGCCWTVHAVPLPQCHRMTLQSILRPLTPWKKCPRLEALLLPRHGGHPYPLGQDALAIYEGEWGNHSCSDCPCFYCVSLRWARKPKCTCGRRASRLKRTLGLDDEIRKRRLHCKCRPPTQVWGTFWCLCEKTLQWSCSGSPRFLIAEAKERFPEATLDGSSGSDVEADSPRCRQRRRITM